MRYSLLEMSAHGNCPMSKWHPFRFASNRQTPFFNLFYYGLVLASKPGSLKNLVDDFLTEVGVSQRIALGLLDKLNLG